LASWELKHLPAQEILQVFKPLPEMLDHGNFIGPTYHPHVVREGWTDEDFEGASESDMTSDDEPTPLEKYRERERQRNILIHKHEKYWPQHDKMSAERRKQLYQVDDVSDGSEDEREIEETRKRKEKKRERRKHKAMLTKWRQHHQRQEPPEYSLKNPRERILVRHKDDESE
jgi:hypothetical protein